MNKQDQKLKMISAQLVAIGALMTALTKEMGAKGLIDADKVMTDYESYIENLWKDLGFEELFKK